MMRPNEGKSDRGGGGLCGTLAATAAGILEFLVVQSIISLPLRGSVYQSASFASLLNSCSLHVNCGSTSLSFLTVFTALFIAVIIIWLLLSD